MSQALLTGLESLSITQDIDYAGWPSPFDDDGVQYAWDSTSLGLLKTCARKYQLSMVLNWQPKKKSYHLIFGILYHSAIENFLKYKASFVSAQDGDDPHEEAVRFAIRQCMIDSFGYEPGLKKGIPDNAKTRVNLIRTLVWYFEHYRSHPASTVILSNGRPAVELSFRFEIGHDLMLAGHLDHIVRFGDGNYVEDHKTTASTVTGASAKHFFQGFNPDNQMTLYSTAAMIAFNTPVKGVIIDAAQIAVGFSAFGRDMTHRSEAQIKEFLFGVVEYRRLAEHFTRQGFWPMNETACGNYGGCAFREICSKSPQVRERFLRTEFTQDKPWNPLEPR
jgi:hypothetical protein